MTTDVFRFAISAGVPLHETEMTLHLATVAAEGLFGAAKLRLDFGYHVDAVRRVILVDGTKDAGSAVVKIFTSLMLREFGVDAFRVSRLSCPRPSSQEVTT